MKHLKYNNLVLLFLSFFIMPINAMEHLYKESLKKISPSLRPGLRQFPSIYLSGTDPEKKFVEIPWKTVEKIPQIKSMLSDIGLNQRNPPRKPLATLFSQEQIQATLNILKSYNGAPNRGSAQNQLKNNSLDTLIESLPVLTYFGVEKNIEDDCNAAILWKIKKNPQDLLHNESIVTLDSAIREKIMTKPIINNLENKLISQYNPQDKGKKVRLYQPSDDWINGEFNHNGTQLIALKYNSITLWDITDPTQPKKKELITNKDGRNPARSAFSRKSNLLASSLGNRLTLWDTTHFDSPIAYELEFSGDISSITFTPDDNYLIVGGSEITLWNITDLQNPKKSNRITLKDDDKIVHISCNAHQKYILSTITNKDHQKYLKIFDINDIDNITGHDLESDIESNIENAFFSPDGTKVVAYFCAASKHPLIPTATKEAMEKASKKIVIWDISEINKIKPKPYYLPDHTYPVIAAAYRPVNSELISSELISVDLSGTIIFWDLSNLNDIKQYPFDQKSPGQISMTLSPDGTKIASHTATRIILWDITPLHECTSLLSLGPKLTPIVYKIRFSPDGTQILTESNELYPAGDNTWYNGFNLILWNLVTKEQKSILQNIRNYEPNILKVLLALSFASLDNVTLSLSDANLALIDELPQEIKSLLLFKRNPHLYVEDIRNKFSDFQKKASSLATWISGLIWQKKQTSSQPETSDTLRSYLKPIQPSDTLGSFLKPIGPEAE